MTLYPLSARKLGAKLASGAVTAQEQAFYLAGSLVLWLLPAYLFIDPGPLEPDPWWSYSMWFYEFAVLVVITIVGVQYCLRKCHIEPSRHFLVDFSCLYFPVSLTTLVVAWALFWAITYGRFQLLNWWIDYYPSDRALPRWPLIFGSARFSDLMRFLAIAGCNFVVYYRISGHIEQIAQLRESANPTPNSDARKSSARQLA